MFSDLGYDDASPTAPRLQHRRSTRVRPRQSRHRCGSRTTQGIRRLTGALPLGLSGGLISTSVGMFLYTDARVWGATSPQIRGVGVSAHKVDMGDSVNKYMPIFPQPPPLPTNCLSPSFPLPVCAGAQSYVQYVICTYISILTPPTHPQPW